MAFPLSDYMDMLRALRGLGYDAGPVKQYWGEYPEPFIFLRHDVDRFSGRAVRMAQAESKAGFLSTYYFRCRPGGVFPEKAVREIAVMGHEIGYHYDVMTQAKGNTEHARILFREELARLRELAEVATVAAHGSPLSRFSNMRFSEGLDLESLGLLGEPQVHMDFSRVFYVTDTGGIFGSPHNRRDWSNGKNLRNPTSPNDLPGVLQPRTEPLVLITTHPERWPEGNAAVALHSIFDWLVNGLKTWLGAGAP